MSNEGNNLRIERIILNISMLSCLAIAIGELIVGLILHANSVITIAIIDGMDTLLTLPFILLVPKLYKPATEKKPFGYGQIESLMLLIEYSIQTFVILSMIVDNIKLIIAGGNDVDAFTIAILQIACAIACIIVYLAIAHFARKFKSPVIKLELFMWKISVLSCSGVAAAFLLGLAIQGTTFGFLAPYFDPAVAVIVALILIRNPLTSIVGCIRELILFAPKEEIMSDIRGKISESLENTSYTLAFLDVLQTGRTTWIEVYMESSTGIFVTDELVVLKAELMQKLGDTYENLHLELAAELPDHPEKKN